MTPPLTKNERDERVARRALERGGDHPGEPVLRKSRRKISHPKTRQADRNGNRRELDPFCLSWDKGLKTTCYLRTLQASTIEKSTSDVKKDTRGVMRATPEPKSFTAEENNGCGIAAMMNGGAREALPISQLVLFSTHNQKTAQPK